jgi:hypothetical protein
VRGKSVRRTEGVNQGAAASKATKGLTAAPVRTVAAFELLVLAVWRPSFWQSDAADVNGHAGRGGHIVSLGA